jgi:alpha-ribazole phosphatase
MKASSIDLLRHGKTVAGSAYIGSSDVALVDLGWQQMRESVEQALCKDQQWDVILSSPLVRCADFARNLADELNIPLAIESQLREYHFGDWEQMTALEVMDKYPGKLEVFWQDPLANPPSQGENLAEFSKRIDCAILNVHKQYADQRVLIICHGGVMRYLLSAKEQLPISAMLSFSVEHGQLIRF